MSIEKNELSQKAMGGTELMQHRLHHFVSDDLLSKFQIIPSRVRKLDPKRKKIYWVHDLATDPEVQHLKDGGWDKFDKIVFVSHWQQQMYNLILDVPYSKGIVLKNAIVPIEPRAKSKEKIKLIYTSTPHRGLDILVAVFKELVKEFDFIELDVYSSFRLYGWPERDKPYREIIKECQKHPNINYHKSVPNNIIRDALNEAHILAYPSTWQETSCLCLIEAMAAGLLCVHSSLAALPETSSGLTFMYDYSEDVNDHAQRFYHQMRRAIMLWKNPQHRRNIENQMNLQSQLANSMYGWDTRKLEWKSFLQEQLTTS